MTLYIVGVVAGLRAVGLWNVDMIKDTVIWLCMSGFSMVIDFVTSREDEDVFKKVIRDNVKAVIILGFLVNTYTFSFVGELLFFPVVTFLVLLDSVARMNKQHAGIARLTTYESAFVRLRMGAEKPSDVVLYARRRIFRPFGVRLKKLSAFIDEHDHDLKRIRTTTDIDALLCDSGAAHFRSSSTDASPWPTFKTPFAICKAISRSAKSCSTRRFGELCGLNCTDKQEIILPVTEPVSIKPIRFWIQWTLATAVGWVVAGAFSAWMVPAFFGWGFFGFLQWLVLRKALQPIGRWIVLSAIAGSLGIGAYAGVEMLLDRYEPPMMWSKMFDAEDPVQAEDPTATESEAAAQGGERDPALWIWAVAGSLLGGLMGALQWVALRSCVSRAWLWLVATPLSWAAGAVLVGMFLMPLFYGSEEPAFGPIDVFIPVALGGLVVGACSGAALVYMIQNSTKERVQSEA